MKRKTSVLGAIVGSAILMTACTGDTSTDAEVEVSSIGAMDDFKVGDSFKATEPITFPILYSEHPNYPFKRDWLFFEELEKRTSITFDETLVPMSDYEQKRSLLVSSGDAPLILPKTYPGQESAFVSSGAILPVSEYVDMMPHFLDKVEKWDMEEELNGLRQEDGKFYLLPGLHEEVRPDYTLAIRTDIFEEQKLEIPETWDELLESLRVLKEAYPDITPFSDRYNFNSTLNVAATPFGTIGGWGLSSGLSFNQEDDAFEYSPASNEYKELLTYFHTMVDEGLLDRESFTQDDEQAIQKFVTGNSFVINANSQDIVTYRNSLNDRLGEGKYSISKIPVPAGPAGNVQGGGRFENGIMISSKALESENFKAMMQFIDWLWYSDEGLEFAKWGVEGETFTKSEDGTRTLTEDIDYIGMNPEGTKALNVDFGFANGVFAYGGATELTRSIMSDEEIEFQEVMSEKDRIAPNPPVPYSDEVRERATLLSTPLKDFVEQSTLQFILGSRDLSEFDQYVEELRGRGMDEFVDLSNEAYQNYKQNVE
ncbi:extracellular solute-binding protein [Alkalihalobacillus sp. FSL R5-0424]